MIDTGLGNLQSVNKAFERIGANIEVTTDPQVVSRASGVILPGVGAFGDGMKNLRRHGLVEVLKKHALVDRKPLLGICLGMQLMAQAGEEHGLHEGLGLVPGKIVRIDSSNGVRVPNIGWCDVVVRRPCVLFRPAEQCQAFYFAHSFYLDSSDSDLVVATIDYGRQIPAAIERGNLFGVQFHPEKSQDAGLNAISTFVDYVRQ